MWTLTEDQLARLRNLGSLLEGTGDPVNRTTDRYVLVVEMTDAEYDLDDDEEDSIPWQVSEIVGTDWRTEWQDGYEPLPSGRTRAQLDIIPDATEPIVTFEDEEPTCARCGAPLGERSQCMNPDTRCSDLDDVFQQVEDSAPGGEWEEKQVCLVKGTRADTWANVYYPGDGRGIAVLATGEITEEFEA